MITLAIIGVVAALTIPTVVKNYQKQQTVVKVKKAYSILSQALNNSIAENGQTSTWNFPASQPRIDLFMEKYITKYLKVMKNCGVKTTGDCAVKTIKYFNSTPIIADSELNNLYYRIFLNDGSMLVAYYNADGQIILHYDIDGLSGPGLLGRDVFGFFLVRGKEKITFHKIQPTNVWWGYCGKDGVSSPGYACTDEILRKGKIEYDW